MRGIEGGRAAGPVASEQPLLHKNRRRHPSTTPYRQPERSVIRSTDALIDNGPMDARAYHAMLAEAVSAVVLEEMVLDHELGSERRGGVVGESGMIEQEPPADGRAASA